MQFIKTVNSLILCLAICGPVVLAHGADLAEADDTDNGEQDYEQISVTGSHLKGVDLENAQPLISLDEDAIKRSGAATIAELLKNVGVTRSGSGSFNTSTSGATSNSTPAGQAAASLRGLGASSTLTLVNGRRIAVSSFAAGNTNFVDINSIPLAAIKRVEILATGASAVYGADAVAGVINYILKDDYEGAEIGISYGNSDAPSDDGKLQVNAVYGLDLDRGNLTLFADYYRRGAFTFADRDITRTTFSPATNSTYPRIFWRDTQTELAVVDPSCPINLQTNDADYGGFGDGFCAYDPNPLTQVYPELEAMAGGLTMQLELSDNLQMFTEWLYSSTSSDASSNSAGFSSIGNSSRVSVATTHPQFPAPWLAQIYPADATEIRIRGRFAEPRKIAVDTDASRFLFGLRGTLASWGDGDWEWESAINYSRSRSQQQAIAGIYNRYKFNAALRGELCADGSGDCTPAQDGLYFNPFAGQTGNEQVLALIAEHPSRAGKSEMFAWDLKLNGIIGQFRGDDIAAVVGVEARREEIVDIPSELAVAQRDNDYIVDVIGFGSSRVRAERDQWAAFGELNIPVTASVSVQTAWRYDHYDDFGGDFNPKISARYQVSEALVARASWATSFRAPSLSQAGAELRTTSFTARCLEPYKDAFCGDAAELNPNSIEVGNPNLQAEESESMGVGAAWNVTDDITATLDFWHFQHDNVVDVDAEGFLTQAYNNPQQFMYCGLVPADAIGISLDPFYCTADVGATEGETVNAAQLQALVALEVDDLLFRDHVLRLENVGQQEVSGVDFTYTQNIDDTSLGDFRITVDATKLFSFRRDRNALSGEEQLAGSFRYPTLISSAALKWYDDTWSGGITAHYTHGYDDEIFTLSDFDLLYIEQNFGVTLYDQVAGELVPRERRVSSWTTFDAHVRYEYGDNIYLRLTINNVTNKEPPLVYGGYRSVDFLNHDSMGRYYRLSAVVTF